MAWQDALRTELESRQLDQLEYTEPAPPEGGSNLIQPTIAELRSIVLAIRARKTVQEIKALVKRGNLKFSFEQIREIKQIYDEVLAAKKVAAGQ